MELALVGLKEQAATVELGATDEEDVAGIGHIADEEGATEAEEEELDSVVEDADELVLGIGQAEGVDSVLEVVIEVVEDLKTGHAAMLVELGATDVQAAGVLETEVKADEALLKAVLVSVALETTELALLVALEALVAIAEVAMIELLVAIELLLGTEVLLEATTFSVDEAIEAEMELKAALTLELREVGLMEAELNAAETLELIADWLAETELLREAT